MWTSGILSLFSGERSTSPNLGDFFTQLLCPPSRCTAVLDAFPCARALRSVERRFQRGTASAGARYINRPSRRANRAALLRRTCTEVVPDCQENVGRDAHNVARRRMDFPTRARLHTVREIGKERLIRWWCVGQAARLTATRSIGRVAPLLLQVSVRITVKATSSTPDAATKQPRAWAGNRC